MLEDGGEIDGVLDREGGDGDEGTAAVCDDAGEVLAYIGKAYLCLSVVTIDFDPLILQDAETGLELVSGLFCALCASLCVEDGFARGLWKGRGFCGWALGGSGGRAVGGGRSG